MEIIKAKRVTRAMVRAIKQGQSVSFCLPDGNACECARTVVSQVKALDRIDLSARVNYEACVTTITRG